MMAQRKTMPKLQMPCYDLEDVPLAAKDLSTSVVVRVKERADWMGSLSEMLLLCNEAAARRLEKFGLIGNNSDGTHTKPLGLEYMADRLDTDDPLEGFQVRSVEGWLQGFITTTTFTVWQRAFRWDSLAPENGFSVEEMTDRKWDSDNMLACELEMQDRAGDPDAEGIIWPKLAEISLLGGLGCGSWLLRLVIEEFEVAGLYEYVIVQATDNSVPFYETFGFIRVGAVAKYREKTHEQLEAMAVATKKNPPGKSNSKKRRGSEHAGNGDEREKEAGHDVAKLPSWCYSKKDGQLKRFKFILGGASGRSSAAAAEEFYLHVDKQWEAVRGFRLYQRFCDESDGEMKYREWRKGASATGVEPVSAAGRQRFEAHKVRQQLKPFPRGALLQVAVEHGRLDTDGSDSAYVEIVGEEEAVAAAYVRLNDPHLQVAAAPLKHGDMDWNNHSHANVARRRAAGFVPYCHWTFPEQSVEDLGPSYMMARRLVKRVSAAGGAMDTLGPRMRNVLPEKLRTRHDPDAHTAPVHTGCNYDDVSPESIKKSMYNKVVTVVDNKHKHDYYYVLHYILDMDWCHLVPMHSKSVFGGESFRAGRPRYKLVPEGEGREIDVPAARCRQVLAYAVSKTNNADKEVWDIVLPEEQQEYEKKLAEESRRQRNRGGGGADRGEPSGNESSRRRQEPWEQAAHAVMRKLMRRKNAWPFLEAVDPVALGLADYLQVVKHPMDLSTIKEKLDRHTYASFPAWRADLDLTFDNAILYNPPENRIHELAVEMKAAAAEAVAKEEGKAGALRAKSEREEGRAGAFNCTSTTAGTPHSTMSHSTMSSEVSSPTASGYSGTAGFCWDGCSSSGGGREAEESIGGGIQTEHQAAAAPTSDTRTNGHNDSRESARRWLR